jgi:hypothetical protein
VSTHHLGAILTVTTAIFVCPNGVGGIYGLLNHMTSDNLMTHQLPRAADECRPHLLARYPQLADVQPPEFTDEAHVWRWLAEQCEQFGTWFEVTPMDAADHTVIDPVTELQMMRPDMPVVAFEVPRSGDSGDEQAHG